MGVGRGGQPWHRKWGVFFCMELGIDRNHYSCFTPFYLYTRERWRGKRERDRRMDVDILTDIDH